jgi:hypothetical protein
VLIGLFVGSLIAEACGMTYFSRVSEAAWFELSAPMAFGTPERSLPMSFPALSGHVGSTLKRVLDRGSFSVRSRPLCSTCCLAMKKLTDSVGLSSAELAD